MGYLGSAANTEKHLPVEVMQYKTLYCVKGQQVIDQSPIVYIFKIEIIQKYKLPRLLLYVRPTVWGSTSQTNITKFQRITNLNCHPSTHI